MADADQIEAGSAQPMVGVRLPGSSRLDFFRCDVASVETGTWVIVPGEDGPRAARVVIAPTQILLARNHGNLEPMVRVLSEEEVAGLAVDELVAENLAGRDTHRDAPRRLGGLGPSGRPPAGRSVEDERYRNAKARLPRLGQPVATPAGEGLVVSLSVANEEVAVRLNADGREILVSAGVVSAIASNESGD